MRNSSFIIPNSKFLITTIIIVLISLSNTVSIAEDAYAAMPGGDQTVTLELQGVNILDVFKLLSKKSGLNIVAGRNVQGQVSIFLQNVPVRDALRTILESQGLASIEEGGILKVIREEEYFQKYGRPYDDRRITKSFHLRFATTDELAGKLSELKSQHGKILTEPRTNTLLITELPEILKEMEVLIGGSDQPQETEIFYLRYADAEELETKIESVLEGGSGKLEVDKRANRIVIMDIPSRIEKVRMLVEAFDVQVPQVLIEAKIVEVRLNDGYRRGINWEKLIGKISDFNTITATAPLLVSPPTGASALSTLVLGSGSDDLKIVIDLLEQVGKTNLLSSPRLTVMNNEEAKLAVATREPFVSQTVVQTSNSTNTADNVQFVDVGVTLTVEPKITHDNFVEMKVKPEVSSSNQSLELEGVAQGSNTTFTRTRIPVVTTQELETTVLVKSGTTIIIGGLIQDKQDKQTSKVPIIGSIPVLGHAFQSKSHDYVKTELVTFITPTIIQPGQSTKETERFFEPENTLKPFAIVGGDEYKTTYAEPLRYLKTGSVPYWEEVGRKSTDHSQQSTDNG